MSGSLSGKEARRIERPADPSIAGTSAGLIHAQGCFGSGLRLSEVWPITDSGPVKRNRHTNAFMALIKKFLFSLMNFTQV